MRQEKRMPRKNKKGTISQMEALIQRPAFQEKLTEMRNEIGFNEKNFDPNKISEEQHVYLVENIFTLIVELQLTGDWLSFIYDFVTTDTINEKLDPHATVIEYGIPEYAGIPDQETISIRINSDTRLRDVKEAYSIAKDLFNSKPRVRTRSWNYKKRDSRIFELRNKGKTFREITAQIEQEFNLPHMTYEHVRKTYIDYSRKVKGYIADRNQARS